MNTQVKLDPKQQQWVELQQAYLRKNLDELKPKIKTAFTGEEERSIRQWLFQVTSKTMDKVTPMESCGRVVLTEFYPDRERQRNGEIGAWGIDPVLPIPLISDLAQNQGFVDAFRAMYGIQQEFVATGGPNSHYGDLMLDSIRTMKNSGINDLLTQQEHDYFWDMTIDVLANPFQYLTIPKTFAWQTWHYALIFIATLVATLGLLSLLS